MQNFSLPKKRGPQRKDFGDRYGFPGFHRVLVSTTGLESFSLRPEKFPKGFSFGGGRVRFLLLCFGSGGFGSLSLAPTILEDHKHSVTTPEKTRKVPRTAAEPRRTLGETRAEPSESRLVAQCSATPATVAATPPCSATPFQTQISVRHLAAQGGGGATPKFLGGVA